jgi:putative intracellular protease/amidase
MKVLIVATSHAQMGDSIRRTGLWLEELVIPYYIFKEAGAVLTIASPLGGAIPLDPKSESILASTPTIRRFQNDPACVSDLSHSTPLNELKAEDFDMVFVAGGHGAMWDFRENTALKELLGDFIRQHKITGFVCHGAAALLGLQDDKGDPFVKGRRLTAYSNSEEEVAGLTKVVPFSLESELVAAGALYSKSADYTNYMVTDGHLICGQNSISSRDVSRTMLVLLKKSREEASTTLH